MSNLLTLFFSHLKKVIPANAYVAEDGETYYMAENGVTYYVQES